MANDDFLVPAPSPFIEASIEIAEQWIGSYQAGPADGDPVLLLHGFP